MTLAVDMMATSVLGYGHSIAVYDHNVFCFRKEL